VENQPGVDWLQVRTQQESESVSIVINSNGATLGAEVKDALTTPFAVTQELGVGVGLPLCRMIIEKHGSSFVIEDRPEGGTRYCVRLMNRKEA
jgi:C4-dicarboxylate-specific signal transduction histidine kinase